MQSPLYVNGKFTAQRLTGVQRYALEILRALDQDEAALASLGPVVLLCPPQGNPPRLDRIAVEICGLGGLPLHAWEQVVLPWRARHGRLLSLAGSAPAFAADATCTLHDAAVFDHPEAFSSSFGHAYRALFRWHARRRRQLLTVSEFSRSRLSQALCIESASLEVVPGAGDHIIRTTPDPAVLSRLGLQHGQYWLVVASLSPTKRLDLLVRAWQRTASTSAYRPLVWVGGLNSQVFSSPNPPMHAEGLIVAGVVDDGMLKALLSSATALVIPSIYEGFCLPAREAMACACPVIAARAAALPEVAGEAAWWVPPDDVDALATALERVAQDTNLRERLVQAGAAHVADRTWRASARTLARRMRPDTPVS